MKVVIIGAGNMGGAVARGLAKGNMVQNADITVSNPSEGKLVRLKEEYDDIVVTTDNVEAVKGADVVILAVKPWKMEEVILQIRDFLDYNRVIVASLAAGITIKQIIGYLQHNDAVVPPVYRVMPNTAAAVGESMTFLSSERSTAENDKFMTDLFAQMGQAVMIEERLMGAAMSLASCGIAFVMRYIRAATEGGVELGLYPQQAQSIMMQTMKGAVALLEATGANPEQEIDKVTTPGGITIKGLNTMEEHGFTNSVIKGLKASAG